MCILEHKSPSSLLQEMVKEKHQKRGIRRGIIINKQTEEKEVEGEIKGRNEMFTVTMLGVMHMIPF